MTVVLETERLFVRELLLNDVEPLAALWADPEVMKFLGGPREPGRARAFIHAQQSCYREHDFGVWAVIHRDSASFVGLAGIDAPDELKCELAAAYWEAGVGTEVLVAIRDHAFASLELDALTAKVPKKCRAGRKLADRLKMAVEQKGDATHYRLEKEAR